MLTSFLRGPERFGADAEDRRLRIRVADRIAHTIPSLPELAGYAGGAAVWSVECAVDDARRQLREARRAR